MAGFLSGEVNIPHVGRLPKLAVAGGIAAVIAAIIYERRKQSAAAAAAPASAAAAAGTGAYPPDGTTGNPADPYSTDPATGQTYGDEGGGVADTGLQNAATWPWDGTYDNSGDPYSLDSGTGLTYGAEGYSGGSGTGGSGGGSGGPPFSTNSQWSQYVLSYFTNESFGDIGGMTTAIGLYLAGQPVDATQAGYIHDATAIAGNPPVAGAGNFPPSIRQQGSHGGTVTVPNVVGVDVEQATQILTAAGLKAKGPAGVKGVVHVVTKQAPAAGAHTQKGTLVTLTTKNVTEHKPAPKPVKK